MAPTPQEYGQNVQQDQEPADNAVVISGISGEMPGCQSFLEFGDKLFMNQNLVSKSSRWKNYSHPDCPEHYGLIDGLDKFDAQFFTVQYKLAHSCDPGSRKIFEQTYQAVFDAGICPTELSNKRIGVFLAVSLFDSEKSCANKNIYLGLVGASKAMFSNRISFWLNLKGPSFTLDGDSCGAATAIEHACESINKGYCEAAIVGCAKTILDPQISVVLNRERPANPDGKTKCYDANADGQSFSEAVNVMFLQKYKDARRVYAFVRHAKVEFGATDEIPNSELIKIPRDVKTLSNFYRKFYKEAGVDPSSVEYVEGFGAASHEMDKVELQALEEVLCQDRQRPLLVGSVASNTGYTEASSTACGLFKVLLAYQRGEIPASINCDNPRQDVAALRDGRMRILTENAPLMRARTAVNAFSYTGLNGHILLEGYAKKKDPSRYHSEFPYLVMASGRQESCVEKILADIRSRQLDPEEIALLHNLFNNRIGLHLARGFGVYSNDNGKTIAHRQKVDYYDGAKRPLWFVYTGMGSQWVGMGTQLMRIPLFAESIKRSHKILEPKGIDLIQIITTKDENIFNNILHSFVGIAAIQIALTDILKAIGLVPDNIIGHSVGELGCAYADGCFTAEQVLNLSYLRGYLSLTIPTCHGAMAAIGLGYKQIINLCPPEIEVACHNSATSSTISGPAEVVRRFVDQLTANGIFAKEVNSSNIAYHSRYIVSLGVEFIKQSKELVKTPKLRSERWLSSSVPHDKWDEPAAKYSSAEYHTNNLLSTVLFEETLRFVPTNAVLVEIAPHGLLQAILKRALPSTCQHVSLTRRGHPDGASFLLEAIGDLYMHGYDPVIADLYPKVEFPVSSATRPLSHLVEWVHSEDWKVTRFVNPDSSFFSKLKLIVSLDDDENKHLRGHQIEGICVLPFAACLVAAWDVLCMTINHEKRKLSVLFQNLKFYSQPAIFEHQLQYLTVTLQQASGHFEVFEGNIVIAEGTISAIAKNSYEATLDESVTIDLSKEDIYKLFYERGHEYKDEFRCLYGTNSSLTETKIKWNDNWVTFIDAIIQSNALRQNHQGISYLRYISKLIIDFKENLLDRTHYNNMLVAKYDDVQKRTRCGGVTVEHTVFKEKHLTTRQEVLLKTLKFIPFYENENKDISTAITIMTQIIAENKNTDKITMAYVKAPNKLDYIKKISKILNNLPEIEIKVVSENIHDILQGKALKEHPDAIFIHDLICDKKVLEALYHIALPDTFIISIGAETKSYPTSMYKPVSVIRTCRTKVELAKFKPSSQPSNTTAVSIRNISDMERLQLNCEDLPPQHRILVLAPYPTPAGIKDQVKIWRKHNKNVSMVMFDQRNAINKGLESMPDLAFSVLLDGKWGSEYYVPTACEAVPSKSMVSLRCHKPGDLDSLNWVQVNEPSEKQGIDVTVYFAGLTAVDAAMALEQTPGGMTKNGFGMDFSGITARGERVMGLLPRKAASTHIRVSPNMLWPVPAHWTLEDAATVPYAYAHAMYCLYIKTWLMPGMKVFVYGGAGALGQAAITIALAHGCEVFTTVNDVRKKHFLRKLFPQLKENHIGNSRDDAFQYVVKNATNGTGCDILLSCAKGELKKKYFSCMALNGNIIDTAQLVTRENVDFEYRFLSRQVSYHAVDFSSIFEEGNTSGIKKLQLMLSEGIIKGYVRPLSRVTYESHEVSRAIRLLTASRHRGRVLISLRDKAPLVEQRLICNSSGVYVVIYNDEMLGLQVADMLIKRGATKLVVHGDQTTYLKHKIDVWEDSGVLIKVSSANLTIEEETTSMLKHSNSVGNVEGIYMVSSDPEGSQEAVASVLTNLDSVSRKLCPDLRHFALISENDKPWKEILNKRAYDGFPTLQVQLQKLDRFSKSDDEKNEEKTYTSLTPNSAINAIEKALCSGDSIVLANAQPIVPLSILEKVAKIPGVNITNATVDRTSLEQVGVDEGRAQEVCNLLEEKFHIAVSPQTVPQMTIGQLKQLKSEIEDIERDIPGMWAYLSSFDGDEMMATTNMVVMPTLVHRSFMRPDEFDSDHDYLAIVPGLEGNNNRFGTLCERLKIPAAVLQPGTFYQNETIPETAQRMANVIMKYLKPKRGFNVLGFEFGVLIALEIASILESHGYKGTLYMLGGTPEDICSSFKERWNSSDENTMQDVLLQHMFMLITGVKSFELEDGLRKAVSWSEKLDALIKIVRYKVPYSIQYIRLTIEGIYSRIKEFQNYKVQPRKLRSRVVLIQAKPYQSSVQDLKPFTIQEPYLNNLRASFPFAHKDLCCSNIINGYLDPEILEEYMRSNQCEKGIWTML